MAKPTIVTRAGKGSALTWTEGDTNLTNLRDATITVTDGTNSKAIDLNGTIAFTAGTNITLSVNSSTGAVTINSTASVGGVALDDLTDVVITGASTDYILKYSGGNWINAAPTQIQGTSSTGNVDYTVLFGGGVGTIDTVRVNTGNFTFNPSTGTLTATKFAGALNGTVGATTPSTGAFTTLSASSTVSGTGFSTYLASPPAIGGTAAAAITGTTITANTQFSGPHNGTVGATTPNTGAFTTLSASSTVSGTGFSTYLASPPAIGGTAANTGAFTTLSANTTTTNGGINVTYAPSATSGSAIQVSAKGTQGGTAYADFLKVTNTATGSTNPNKTFRLDSAGTIQIINSAYNANIFNLTDAGDFSCPTITSNGSLTFKQPIETIYSVPTTSGTIAPDCSNGSVQKINPIGNITINAFTNPVAGQSVTLIIIQNGGPYTLTSSMKFAGGIKTLTSTASATDIMSIYYDGTNYYASLGKGYA